jgi:NitT/TauT family transport system substrate-binding protein
MKAVKTLAVGLVLGGISLAQSMTEVTMVLNWFAQPPHGGFYAALKDGLYEAKGVKMKITPGGPNVAGYALLGAGNVQFAQVDSAGLLASREEGVPLVAVFASFQLYPQILVFHKDNPVKDFSDLAGRQVAVTPGAPYWDFLMGKYGLKGKLQQVNYTGQIATFLQDKKFVQQGYAISEPYNLKKAGADIGMLNISDAGFNPYTLVATNEDFLRKNPAVVKAVVEATQEGWKRYLANPEKYADTIREVNKNLEPDYVAWAGKALEPYVVGKNDDTKKNGLGWMSLERWTELYQALRQAGVLKKEQDVSKAFTSQFVPKP